jgi:uncharacterized protein (TIGR02145 family)
MKKIFSISTPIILILSIILIYSCKKDRPTPPVITTNTISAITQTTALSGGNVTSDGGASIITCGVCWSTISGPTTALSTKTTDNPGTGIFTSSLTALSESTVYYVKAYATNSAGTAYGNELTFTTSAVPSTVPEATTGVTAVAGNAQATVTFIAPVNNGGSVITGYTVTSSPGGLTAIGTASPIIVNGLTNGIAYTFTVIATNAMGSSVASSASNSVTPTAPITDNDGNVYHAVTIGTQVWLAENLKTTKYNDGTAIPNITDNSVWVALTTGAYCDHSNTPDNSNIYGRLYNWYVVDNNPATKVASNGGKNVCPTGWHVPNDDEWTTLINSLGGESIGGGKLKEIGLTRWLTPNIGATNETGFTALPAGSRNEDGSCDGIGVLGDWWSSTEYSATIAGGRYVTYDDAVVLKDEVSKIDGISVRCVRDF